MDSGNLSGPKIPSKSMIRVLCHSKPGVRAIEGGQKGRRDKTGEFQNHHPGGGAPVLLSAEPKEVLCSAGESPAQVDAGGVLVMLCGWVWAVTSLQWLSEDGQG